MIVTEDTVEFESLNDLIIFTKYNPKNQKSVPSGYILQDDLVNNEGGVLYAKDTEMDATRIGRLNRILENNPEMKPHFVLKRSEQLVALEREKIHAGLNRLIESKRSRLEFSKFMKVVNSALTARWKILLTESDIILFISQLKFYEDKTKKTNINPFYNHMLNTVIFSIGIMMNMVNINQQKFEPDEMKDVALAAILHGARGWETSGTYIEKSVEERKKMYIEENKSNFNYLKKYELNETALETIEFVYQFMSG
ncbi:hypothetical protein ACFL67_02390, partial [candidate division KSB1 bacterium]